MADSLAEFGARVKSLTDRDVLARIARAGGMAGKRSMLDAAARSLGGDRAFSGMRRRVSLGVGFDVEATAVHLNLRPAGLWKLAESGRSSSGGIAPRRRGGKRAVMTPHGPRARSTYGPSRGLDTISQGERDARREVPKAGHRQFVDEIRKVVR